MRRTLLFGVAILAAAALAVGCGGSSSLSPAAPVSPSNFRPTVDYFVGRWTPAFSTSIVVNGTPGCSDPSYTFSKIDASSATVSYDVVCARSALKGTATAVFEEDALKWSANGTVTSGGTSCPFAFTDSTATAQGNDQILVTYNVTVCGLGPFRGSTTLHRP